MISDFKFSKLKNYFVKELGWGNLYESRIVFNFLCQAAMECKGGVVLDAGCGFQRYKPFFYESTYLGMEHPKAGLANKGIIEYDILADAIDIPIKANSIDLILSTSSLEHIESPHLFFKEAYRVLKPGGALYINVPFVYNEHEVPFDFQRPTRYGLQSFFRKNNFENFTVKPTSSSIYTVLYGFQLVSLYLVSKSKGIKRLLLRVINKFVFSLVDIIQKILDFDPQPDEVFPIGWVAIAYKSGSKEELNEKRSKKDIITDIALSQKCTIEENRIISKNV